MSLREAISDALKLHSVSAAAPIPQKVLFGFDLLGSMPLWFERQHQAPGGRQRLGAVSPASHQQAATSLTACRLLQ
jgi:hypothetical protein